MTLSSRIESLNTKKNSIYYFLGIWFVINLIQAFFTELAHDEAYYWMYSQHLDWGYFDHPPMVALLVKIGYSLFQNELGVRLIFVLLGTLSLYNIYRLLDDKQNTALFIVVVSSMILIHGHFSGFLALPDIPLIFFTTVFLRLYKAYLNTYTFQIAILIGLVVALMCYSKYHAILIIAFVVLSNLSLFKKTSFYIAIAIAALLLIPHLIWQINHDFPSFTYHLISRSLPYKFDYTFNYLYSHILITGPVIGVILIYGSFKWKPDNLFQKALHFILWGFYIFFFFMSFKGRVEAHWLASACIPLIILGSWYISYHEKLKKFVYGAFIPVVALFLIIRIVLMSDRIVDTLGIRTEVNHWDEWASEIEQIANERPVVFLNKFQYPSKYCFYTGNKTTSLNNIYYRKNQYDIWNFEKDFQGKEVLLAGSMTPTGFISTSSGKRINYEILKRFYSYFNAVSINFEETNITTESVDSISVLVELNNLNGDSLFFDTNQKLKPYLEYNIFMRNKIISKQKLDLDLENMAAFESRKLYTAIKIPPIEGKYDIYLSLTTKNMGAALNSKRIKLVVK